VIAEHHKGSLKILEYGQQAQLMVGRTPPHQQAIYPLQGGIQNPKLAEELIRLNIQKALGGKTLLKPRSVVAFSQYFAREAPKTLSGILQRTAGKDIIQINSLICSAMGCSLPFDGSTALMVINIGHHGTEVGVLCHSNLYQSSYIPIGGKHISTAIAQYCKSKYHSMISAQYIEQIKQTLCNLQEQIPDQESIIPCKHIQSGQPLELSISSSDVRTALQPILNTLIKQLIRLFQGLSPRIVTDLMENGIVLCGGGALLTELDLYLQEKLNLPVILIDNPQQATIRGAAQCLAQEPYAHWFVE
jgi:rod shape-determining protein MreB and related proteins